MHQLFGHTFSQDAEGPGGLDRAAPRPERQIRLIPSFVRLAREQQATESQREVSPDWRDDGSPDRKLNGPLR